MADPTPIFSTPDEERARAAVGQRFLVGAVPYEATEVAEVTTTLWQVLGIPLGPHPHAAS